MADTTTSSLRELARQNEAACHGLPLSAFFPYDGGATEAAQRACCRCPVRSPCAEYGRSQRWGVWGGVASDHPRGQFVAATKPVVPEGLQPVGVSPYRLTDTTTPPPKEPAMTAKTTTTKTAPAPTEPTPAAEPAATPTDEGRAKSTAAKEGTHDCAVCQQNLPLVKFPTARNAEGTYERDTTECRTCRDARRATRKAEKDAAKATAA